MQQQQCLQTPTPRKKKQKEASPWWDVFSHCKEAADSSSDSEHDDLSYEQYCNDMISTPLATNTADNGPIIAETAPLSPQSVVRATPVKLISDSRSNNYVSGENDVARPDTPGTQDSSYSSLETSSSSSSSVPDDNDMRELSFESIEKGEGEVEEEEEEESNFIGNILLEIKPISPLLSTQQRNIRKNAYHLLKRLGEEGSIVDLNSSIETEVDVGREEEEECDDATNDDDDNDVTSVGSNNDDDDNDDDIMADFHAEIANLTNQLQAATLQSTQDASKIKSLEGQLLESLNKLNEYEETIDSVNEAVDRCHSYNEEIVQELIVSRKENDDLAMRLFEQDSKEKEEGDDNNSNDLPSSKGDTNTPQKITGVASDEDSEPSLVEDDMKNENDDATTATASSPMTCDQFPSVFHRQQQPLAALQDHLLSCIKLPLRVVSILFSVWVTIILLRIVFIFFLIVVDYNSLLEDGGFNTPGIY